MRFKDNIKGLFTSTKGMITVLALWDIAVTLFFSTFSHPMIERFGEMPVLEYIFPLWELDPDRHTARTIMIYHVLAIPFIVAVALYFMEQFHFREKFINQARIPLFGGALICGIFGLDFAYFSGSWISHGLFLFGQSVVFYGAVVYLIGFWPTRSFPGELEENRVMVAGFNLEYLNLMFTIFAVLTSVIIGGMAGSTFGTVDPANGRLWEPILAEEAVREYEDVANVGGSYKEMVVSHLHIMVALLAAAVLMLALRKANLKGFWYKWAQILYAPGVIVISLGAWLVITTWSAAHVVINVGAGFLLLVGAIVATYGWGQIAKDKLGDTFESASALDKVKASFSDPVRWTLFFQLWWVNVVSTFPGVFVAFNLDHDSPGFPPGSGSRDYRSEIMTEIEYSFNVGHWHILATLVGVMVAMMLIDYYGVKDPYRKIAGWMSAVGTILAFGFAMRYMLRMPDTPESSNEFDFWMIDIGLAFVWITLGILSVWILRDIIKGKIGQIKEA